MQVYTFSTGGCRDGYYLDKLSTTKEGVKELIKTYLKDSYRLDDEEVVREILIDDKRIKIIIDDFSHGSSRDLIFELIIFNCL